MASPKLKAVKTTARETFNLAACCAAIAEGIVALQGHDTTKASVNKALADAYQSKVPWKELSGGIKEGLAVRGLSEGSYKNLLTTIKWCYSEAVRFDQHHIARAKAMAEKGLALDLMTGNGKTVKAKGDKAKKKKAKTEGTVNHCGHGMLAAMEQEGFVAFLDALIERVLNGDVDEGSIDDLKIDLVKDALRSCGFAVMKDGELVASVITEADNEGE